LEENNDRDNATDLNSSEVTQGRIQQDLLTLGDSGENPLSIHTADDVDWFKFTIDETGRDGDFAAIFLDLREGDLDLELYDAEGNKIDESVGVSNIQQINLKGLEASTDYYYLKVVGFEGATNQ
jgi:hypothetical protein